jgi:hypothetical protein
MTTAGYVEFEFDLPDALLSKLVQVFDGLAEATLLPAVVESIPEEQGVYQLFLRSEDKLDLVYIGKTDSEAGLRKRLGRHAEKIQQRIGLDPNDVVFKAVRVYVFTAVDLETQLISYYGGTKSVSWNGSGFGSNDPGFERDTTTYKPDHFDTKFPIDIARPVTFSIQAKGKAAGILRTLKRNLPYLIRFETKARNSRTAHDDLEDTDVKIDLTKPVTAQGVIQQVIKQLPAGWHATLLPSHVIIYKNDRRKFPSGRLIAES